MMNPMYPGNPHNMQPGQFGYLTPPPPSRTRPYSHVMLCILFALYIIAVICMFTPASGFGWALFTGISFFVLIADWRGFTTLNGRVRWGKGKRLTLTCVYVFLFPLMLIIYLANSTFSSLHAKQQGHPALPTPGCRPKIASAVAIMVIFVGVVASFTPTEASPQVGSRRNETVAKTNIQPTQAVQTPTQQVVHKATATPKPTSTPTPKPTATPTATPEPTPTPTLEPPTPTPTPVPPTPTPVPTAPPVEPTQPPVVTGVNGNPWGYDFNLGNVIYDPPANFCAYFQCIASFWKSTNGYVMECVDGTYSHSGGRSGSCSQHGGNWRALYSH